MKKRILSGALALILTCLPLCGVKAGAIAIGGNVPEAMDEAAEILYDLGLFRGTGLRADGSPDFQLFEYATRGEAAAMLVRLMGAEREALSGGYDHPFLDAGWADAYVGYSYAAGISSGVSDTRFGTGERIDTAQFLTLALRALGYDEVDWRNPYPTADAVGLEYPEGECYRGTLAFICYSALFCQVKGTDQSLRQQLAAGGAIRDPYAGRTFGPATALVTTISAASEEELVARLSQALKGRCQGDISIEVPAGAEEAYLNYLGDHMDAFSEIHMLTGYMSHAGGLSVSAEYGDAQRVMAYLEGKRLSLSDDDAALLQEALRVHDVLVEDGMDDYRRVRAFHDYLVNHTVYGAGDRSYSAAGALLDGKAVCDGYAHAFDLLCYLSGIDCLKIAGTANGGGHAWNKVELDGVWYNVDVTWDDPVVIGGGDMLRYDYFLVSDETLARDHQWTAYSGQPDCPADYF